METASNAIVESKRTLHSTH